MKILPHRKFPPRVLSQIPQVDNAEWVAACRDFGYLPIWSRKKLKGRILAIRNMLDDNAKKDALPSECLKHANSFLSLLRKHPKNPVGCRKPIRYSYSFCRSSLSNFDGVDETLASKTKTELRKELSELEKQLSEHYNAAESGADFLVEAWMSQWNRARDLNYWGTRVERLRSQGLTECDIIDSLEEEWYERSVEADQDDGPLFDDAMLGSCVGISRSDDQYDDCGAGPYGDDFLHPEFDPDFG